MNSDLHPLPCHLMDSALELRLITQGGRKKMRETRLDPSLQTRLLLTPFVYGYP